jgi:membrane protein
MEYRVPKFIRFASRVLRDFFFRNHGLVLTSAVAFNMMLSLIPLSAVLMVISSLFFESSYVMERVTWEVSLFAPGFESTLREVLMGFLGKRGLIGWVGLGSLMISSSVAFGVLDDAIAIVFFRPQEKLKRKFWISMLMPYLFVLIVALGLIFITAVNAFLDTQGFDERPIFAPFIYLFSLGGLVALFSLFYKLMPMAKVSFKLALWGGVTATLLWEIVRHILVAYYTQFSSMNILFGSMATIIIVMLTLQAIAFILLLGAQVIADLQRNRDAKLPWYEDPENQI